MKKIRSRKNILNRQLLRLDVHPETGFVFRRLIWQMREHKQSNYVNRIFWLGLEILLLEKLDDSNNIVTNHIDSTAT